MIEEVLEKTSDAKIRKKVSPVLIKEVSKEQSDKIVEAVVGDKIPKNLESMID